MHQQENLIDFIHIVHEVPSLSTVLSTVLLNAF